MLNLQEHLSEKYIAYLDVLGFKDLIYNRKHKEVEIYFNTINDTLNEINVPNSNIQSLLISDSTILIAPESNESFKVLLHAVQIIQAKLIKENIWLRGAITFGEVYVDKNLNIVVGKGLVDAFLLEQEAVYPRVIIDSSIVLKVSENSDGFLGFVNPSLKDFAKDKMKLVHSWQTYTQHDSFFVAYAHEILLEAIHDRSMNLIYDLIQSNLYKDHRYYGKYLWVKDYFSEVLNDFSWRWNNIWRGSEVETANRDYINEWLEKFHKM